MLITKIEEIEKAKYKVYIEYQYAFLLYLKDISNYSLVEGDEISQFLYDKIMVETVIRRAKQKAVAILKFKDRTEQELRDKLTESFYPVEAIDEVISYVKEYGYQDDKRYAHAYIRDRMKQKSKLFIKMKLLQKGVKKDLLQEALEEEYGNNEEETDMEVLAIRKLVLRKCKSGLPISEEEKKKLMNSLYRKGFQMDKIRKEIKEIGRLEDV